MVVFGVSQTESFNLVRFSMWLLTLRLSANFLGIALYPAFPPTLFVYLYYTQSSTSVDSSGSPLANRVYHYTWNGSALVSPSLISDLLLLPDRITRGGTMTFGPDGKLYRADMYCIARKSRGNPSQPQLTIVNHPHRYP